MTTATLTELAAYHRERAANARTLAVLLGASPNPVADRAARTAAKHERWSVELTGLAEAFNLAFDPDDGPQP